MRTSQPSQTPWWPVHITTPEFRIVIKALSSVPRVISGIKRFHCLINVYMVYRPPRMCFCNFVTNIPIALYTLPFPTLLYATLLYPRPTLSYLLYLFLPYPMLPFCTLGLPLRVYLLYFLYPTATLPYSTFVYFFDAYCISSFFSLRVGLVWVALSFTMPGL